MNLLARLRSIIRGRKPAIIKTSSSDLTDDVLREFVYLDEVSLRSLLSSKKGGITESVSEQIMAARLAELAGTAGSNAGLLAKAEIASRFQTTDSSMIQTSRKATVQSWFREFLEIPDLRFIRPPRVEGPAANIEALVSTSEHSLVTNSSDLQRGALVEFRVSLSADPVFHLGTLVSEFTGMADDYPDMFSAGNALASLQSTQPINKILQRLLAGLIPIRAVAIDYSVVEIDGNEYISHNALLEGLGLDCKPLVIVGVTEHIAYWKDIRRVLFSDAEFTMMCRISRSGLQRSWTPVKLADLFRDLTPNLVDHINAAGRIPFGTAPLRSGGTANDIKLRAALNWYKAALLQECGKELSAHQDAAVNAGILEVQSRSATASDQRSAFARINQMLIEVAGIEIDPTRDLELRDSARDLSGLSLFPHLSSPSNASPSSATILDDADERLLDVEVIAVYW